MKMHSRVYILFRGKTRVFLLFIIVYLTIKRKSWCHNACGFSAVLWYQLKNKLDFLIPQFLGDSFKKQPKFLPSCKKHCIVYKMNIKIIQLEWKALSFRVLLRKSKTDRQTPWEHDICKTDLILMHSANQVYFLYWLKLTLIL